MNSTPTPTIALTLVALVVIGIIVGIVIIIAVAIKHRSVGAVIAVIAVMMIPGLLLLALIVPAWTTKPYAQPVPVIQEPMPIPPSAPIGTSPPMSPSMQSSYGWAPEVHEPASTVRLTKRRML